MKERPIIFSAPMIQAIMAGRKTQTRRIIKPQPVSNGCYLSEIFCPGDKSQHGKYEWIFQSSAPFSVPFKSGMRLWVKETFAECDAPDGEEPFIYREDWERKYPTVPLAGCWTAPIFMPRRLSRITLEIVDVRVERLQEISEIDAFKEGCGTDDCRRCNTEGIENGQGCEDCSGEGQISSRANYRKLWESIHGARSWDLNPWVFVISFKRIEEGQPHD